MGINKKRASRLFFYLFPSSNLLSNGRVQHRQSLCPRGLWFPQETKGCSMGRRKATTRKHVQSAIVKDKNNGLNGMAPQGGQLFYYKSYLIIY